MNELQIFQNHEFGEVRTVNIGGEPWFVGRDIALALGYSNTKDALAKHVDDDDKKMGSQNAPPIHQRLSGP
ncbi:BRO-N domain-containing protein [Mitsuokella jalaludinii]|uniref:BRO-N domain-containing protein n=1 Tax=Mitsuokella jalaludinii TaxID=187979 RepID=UPI0030795EE8